MNGNSLSAAARLGFTLGLTALLLWFCAPFITPLIMGGILAAVLWPLHERLVRRKLSPALAAAGVTAGFTLLVLGPLSLLAFLAGKYVYLKVRALQPLADAMPGALPGVEGGGWADSFVQRPGLRRVIEGVAARFPVEVEELERGLRDAVQTVGVHVAELLGQFALGLPGTLLAGVILVLGLFFFLLDGPGLGRFIRRHSFFPATQTEILLLSLTATCRSVVLASVVSGAVQAALFALPLALTGASGVALVATLVFISSFVPMIGSSIVTIGIVLQTFAEGRTGAGLALAIAAFVVAMSDNLVRPAFLRGSANLHPLLAFVAAFGGLQTLGFAGVFIGPILAALLVAALSILDSGGDGERRSGV